MIQISSSWKNPWQINRRKINFLRLAIFPFEVLSEVLQGQAKTILKKEKLIKHVDFHEETFK